MTRCLTILFAILLAAGSAIAQGCGDDDCMGLYFDTAATVPGLYTTGPMEAVTAYLCVSNCTEGSIGGWECEIVTDGDVIAPSWTCAGGGLNVASGVGLFNVGVGGGSLALVPDGDVILLATLTGYVMSDQTEIRFYVDVYPGSVTFSDGPGYVSGSDVNTVVECVVHRPIPIEDFNAHINVPDNRENVEATWSEVKDRFQN